MAAKPKCPYSFPHKSRSAMVKYLSSIGGYSSRDGNWPIEFNVAAYGTDFSFDHIWKEYSKEHIPSECESSPELNAAYYALVRRLHAENEQYMWSWGQEDAVATLLHTDTYQMPWDGTAVKADLELHGRGGKHLVIASFNGNDLSNCSPENLEDALLRSDDGWEWSYEDVRLLYKYVRQCEKDFTPATASEAVEYSGAFHFFAGIVAAEWEAAKEAMAEHEEAVAAAQAVREMLASANPTPDFWGHFYTLCSAAHVSEKEACGE